MAEEQGAGVRTERDVRALLQRALALHRAGRLGQASAIYSRILADDPDNAEALSLLGVIDAQQQRLSQAGERLQRAVELQPNNASAWSNLATVRQAQGELDAAEDACRQAIRLRPQNADSLNNLGNVLAAQRKLRDALTAYHAAIKVDAKHRDALNNLGLTLRDLGKPELAVSVFQEVVQLAPDFARGHLNLAHSLLALGRFQEGWAEYAWRWRIGEEAEAVARFEQPQWRGETLKGRRLLVWCGEDPGEQIFFASLLPELAALDGEILVECAPQLAGLFDRSFPAYRVVPAGGGLIEEGDFDLQVPLAALGALFRKHPAAFPQTGTYLQPDEAVLGYLRRNYKELAERRYLVGFAWQPSEEEAGRDEFPTVSDWRSVLETEGCFFIDLQQSLNSQELARMIDDGLRIHGDPAIDPRESLDDYAAQLGALDLVICTTGTTAHLAAAIGRPVICLAPFAPTWHWGTERLPSPWYPGLRLVRPRTTDGWREAIEQVTALLRQRLAANRAACGPALPQGLARPTAPN